jgi:hypothetical protein
MGSTKKLDCAKGGVFRVKATRNHGGIPFGFGAGHIAPAFHELGQVPMWVGVIVN